MPIVEFLENIVGQHAGTVRSAIATGKIQQNKVWLTNPNDISANAGWEDLFELPLTDAKAALLERFVPAYLAHRLDQAGGVITRDKQDFAARQAPFNHAVSQRV